MAGDEFYGDAYKFIYKKGVLQRVAQFTVFNYYEIRYGWITGWIAKAVSFLWAVLS